MTCDNLKNAKGKGQATLFNANRVEMTHSYRQKPELRSGK